MAARDTMLRVVREADQPICDDCAAAAAGFKQRQSAYQAGTELAGRGLLTRRRGRCASCHKTKTVSQLSGARLDQPVTVPSPPPEPAARPPLHPADEPFDVSALMGRLAAERPVFHSEADFQHALAWRLHQEHPEAQVRLEYRPAQLDRRLYLDLWIELDQQRLAVELKYKTRALSVTHAGEQFDLANHGAQDVGRYDLLKDIARLESVCRALPGVSGLGLTLTNDSAYWKPATAGSIYEQFSFEDGRILPSRMEWGAAAGVGTTKSREAAIELAGRYRVTWLPYTSVSAAPSGEFRYSYVWITGA